jgi:cell division transport system permease protein
VKALDETMIGKLKRYFASHGRNLTGAFGRLFAQPVGSLLTVLVIAIALALPAGLRVLVDNAGLLSGSWQAAADFTVYLGMDVSEERAAQLKRQIEQRDDVASVTFIDRNEALAEFKAQSGFGDALDALDTNPLPHTLVVSPAGGAAGHIEALAAALDALPETDIVQLDTEWVARLRSMLALVGRVVDIATILLGLAVVLVIGNTIRLEINNRSVEIEVMKLVGGSDGFIRRPFLYLGLTYGLVGALMAALLIAAALALLRGPVAALGQLYASRFHLSGLSFDELLILLGGGAVLGWAGAWLAAARHLRAIEPH